MSAYNIVIVDKNHLSHEEPRQERVQFKYGDTWQHEYHIGDTIKWGGNDIGQPGLKRVVVDGVSEPDSKGNIYDYEIHLEWDKIVSVQPSTGKYDLLTTPDTYIVLEE